MKTNPDKHLEEITDKLMKETSLEKPPADFTAKVMFQVYAAGTATATLYKPLISKRSWLIIFGIIALLLIYLVSNGNAPAGDWLNQVSFTDFNNKMINSFTGYHFSPITIYAVVLSAIMLLIQITYLKHYFNKRFES
jgi:hypothetical protein